jgi:hypothetical protein
MGARHLVLLLDEAAQMGSFNLHEFLREVASAFSASKIQLHTLQCHSLATLDRAREIAHDLGEWLQRAAQIHLPSIRVEDAPSFFANRVLKVTGDADLAGRLVPSGVARALCETAGGNPRLMLQYAGAVYGTALGCGREVCDGETVVKAFASVPVGKAGVLFSNEELKRVCQLLPQEWGDRQGRSIATYLAANIGRLFGECEKVAAPTMATACGMSVSDLQKLASKTLAGVPVFEVSQDEIFDTDLRFQLSRELRAKLSSLKASSGTVDQKRHQVQLIVGPHRLQSELTSGLARMLRSKAGALNPKYKALGRASQMGSADIVLGGQIFEAYPPDSGSSFRVLAVALYRCPPPPEMVAAISKGLVDEEWDFVVVCHRDEEGQTWQDWMNGDGGEEVKRALAHRTRFLLHMDPAEESEWVSYLGGEAQPLEQGVKFYANVLAATSQAEFSEEVDRAAEAAANAFERIRPTLETLCYLPTPEEQKLLDSPMWEGQASYTLKDISASHPSFSKGKALSELLPEYLDLAKGKRYLRKAPMSWKVWKRVREKLEMDGVAAIDDIAKHLRERERVVGGASNARSVVEWVLGLMRMQGEAAEVAGGWRYIDAQKARADAAQSCKDLLAKCGAVRARLQAFDHGESAREQLAPLSVLAASLGDCSETHEFLQKRDDLERCLQDLEGRARLNLEWMSTTVGYMEAELGRIRAMANGVPGPIATFLSVPEKIEELAERLQEAIRIARNTDGAGSQREVESINRDVQLGVKYLEDLIGGQGNDGAPKADQVLANVLRHRQFKALTIWYEAPAQEGI